MKSGCIDLRVELTAARLGLRLHRVSEYIVPKSLVAELPIVCSKTTGKGWMRDRSHSPLSRSFQGAMSNIWRDHPLICEQLLADRSATVSDLHSRNFHARLESAMEVVFGREVCGLLGCGDEIDESASPCDDPSSVMDEEAAVAENSAIGMGVELHHGLRQMWGLGS